MPDSAIRPAGFVLLGDLPKIGPYLADLASRDLAILVVTGAATSSLERAAAAFLDTPGHPFAAITTMARHSGDDLAGVIDQITRWSAQYTISGVFCATEVFVEAAAVATDLLGLPGVSLRAARVCRNKLLQRRYLDAYSPRSMLVTTSRRDEAHAQFAQRLPAVIKPLSLWSSKGVRRITSPVTLDEQLAVLGPTDQILVEECVPGREYNVDAIVADGTPLFTAITQKGTNEDRTEFFAELVHTLPPTNLRPGEAETILRTHAAVVERLAFGTGMAHAEYRISDDGRVTLMEIAARPPGDGCLALYHLATGQPIESALLDAALGQPRSYPAPARRARQIYLDHTAGRLGDVTVDFPQVPAPRWLVTAGIWPPVTPGPASDPPSIREVMVLKEPGETLHPISESTHRAVTAIIDAPLDADIDVLERQVRQAIRIDGPPTPANVAVVV
jgi:hypothetical protein